MVEKGRKGRDVEGYGKRKSREKAVETVEKKTSRCKKRKRTTSRSATTRQKHEGKQSRGRQ